MGQPHRNMLYELASEGESGALSAIYRRAIQRYEEEQEAAQPGGPYDAERRSNEFGAMDKCSK